MAGSTVGYITLHAFLPTHLNTPLLPTHHRDSPSCLSSWQSQLVSGSLSTGQKRGKDTADRRTWTDPSLRARTLRGWRWMTKFKSDKNEDNATLLNQVIHRDFNSTSLTHWRPYISLILVLILPCMPRQTKKQMSSVRTGIPGCSFSCWKSLVNMLTEFIGWAEGWKKRKAS